MKMHCYFLVNVKQEASQLYWGGASNYLAPALPVCHHCDVIRSRDVVGHVTIGLSIYVLSGNKTLNSLSFRHIYRQNL